MISALRKIPFVARDHRPIPEKALWVFFILIIAAAVLILIGNLGVMPLWGSEGRWAVICRHMYRSGDIFRPVLGASLYWDKPLLSYWFVLPFAYINSGVTESVVRLPAVFSALMLLLLTFDLARMWFGTRTALLSMALLMTSYGFVFWGRTAQVEMLNAFIILLSIWYFLKHRSDKSFKWLYVLGVIMAIGANLKGLPAYGVPLFSIILLSIVRKEYPSASAWPHYVLAIALSLAVYLAFPLVAVYFTGTWSPLHLVWKENVVRFFKPFDHKGPVWTYFIRIFDLTAPWSLFLPAALINLFPKLRERRASATEIITLFSGIFVFFTLSGSRRSYYLLPIIPFVSILTAHFLMNFSKRLLSHSLDRFVKAFGLLLGLIFIAPLILLTFYPNIFPFVSKGLWTVVILMALVSAGMIVCSITRRVGGMPGFMIAACLIYTFCAIPLFGEIPNIRTQVMEVKSLGRQCAFFRNAKDRVLYYLDRPCPIFSEEAALYDWAMRENGVVIVKQKYNMPKKRWITVVKSRRWSAMIPSPPQHGPDTSNKASGSVGDKQPAYGTD